MRGERENWSLDGPKQGDYLSSSLWKETTALASAERVKYDGKVN